MPDLWSFRPEVGCTETLEWFTNPLGSRTGEQRIALREAPRQSFDYSSRLLDGQQFSRAKTFARRNGAEEVYVPIWSDQVQIGTVGSSDTVLTFDTTWGDWREGSFLAVWEDDASYAVCEIDAITGTDITLTAPVGTTFTDALVVPARTAWMTSGLSIMRGKVRSDVSASFLVRDNIDLAADYVSTYPQYQSLDVLTERPKLVTDVAENIIRAQEYIDNGFGPVEVETRKNYADFGQTLSFHDARGPVLWNRRLWLHSLRGKQQTFWLPSFNRDLDLQATIGSAATTITVASVAPSGFYLDKHIMIETVGGTRYFRQITNAASAGGGNDNLTITALGSTVTVADVNVVCFMSLVRLDADSVSIEHSFELDSVVSIPVMEVPE